MDIDLTQGNDNRSAKVADYEHNHRMGTFTGSWINPNQESGQNTWSHLGGSCRRQFGVDGWSLGRHYELITPSPDWTNGPYIFFFFLSLGEIQYDLSF